jgi:hypothetical protein
MIIYTNIILIIYNNNTIIAYTWQLEKIANLTSQEEFNIVIRESFFYYKP